MAFCPVLTSLYKTNALKIYIYRVLYCHPIYRLNNRNLTEIRLERKKELENSYCFRVPFSILVLQILYRLRYALLPTSSALRISQIKNS